MCESGENFPASVSPQSSTDRIPLGDPHLANAAPRQHSVELSRSKPSGAFARFRRLLPRPPGPPMRLLVHSLVRSARPRGMGEPPRRGTSCAPTVGDQVHGGGCRVEPTAAHRRPPGDAWRLTLRRSGCSITMLPRDWRRRPMDLVDRLRELAARIPAQLPHLQTEEATKNALVMPFLQALGYDVFNPLEVLPEFTADVGIKKGEKVDYAILREGKPVILVECKAATADPSEAHASQLYRYFSVTEARFGVVTNGIRYRIFSDLEAPNKMDERPFLEFDLTRLDDAQVKEIKRFAKESFDLDDILSTASDLKYTKGIKRAIAHESQEPSDTLVKYFARQVYSGNITQIVREQFAPIVRRAFQEFISDRVNERLTSALQRDREQEPVEEEKAPEPVSKIETTDEEREGFYIVRALASEIVAPERVVLRDTQSYCGILLDDNNRKPICRLHFNGSQKYLGVFDAAKKETRVPLGAVAEIHKHRSAVLATLGNYAEA